MSSRFLIVTEKHTPTASQRDGGARVVESLRASLGDNVAILEFSDDGPEVGLTRLRYPCQHKDRFQKRLLNAEWIAARVSMAARDFTDIVFVHISMAFGSRKEALAGKRIWMFPMLLGHSYRKSGESVAEEYLQEESRILRLADRILTPSHFEKKQLIGAYGVPADRIKVIPRGIPDTALTRKKKRPDGTLEICSVGSIKPQKNTHGLVRRFSAIARSNPNARLCIIGPVQNESYHQMVLDEVDALGLTDAVSFSGFIRPESLGAAIAGFDIHMTDTLCETFGRSIFETLSHGLPNLIPGHGNCAAAEHLSETPYCRFFNDDKSLLDGLDELLNDLAFRSELATEVGVQFSKTRLDRLLAAEFNNSPEMLLTDFDGTIFHKQNEELTASMALAARKHPCLVVCSARSIAELRRLLADIGLTPDWLIGLSGAEFESFDASISWRNGLTDTEVSRLKDTFPEGVLIKNRGLPAQMLVRPALPPIGFRGETYHEGMYMSPWRNSKLNTALKLMDTIGWQGRVTAWGDGPHDLPLVNYFDGTMFGKFQPTPQ